MDKLFIINLSLVFLTIANSQRTSYAPMFGLEVRSAVYNTTLRLRQSVGRVCAEHWALSRVASNHFHRHWFKCKFNVIYLPNEIPWIRAKCFYSIATAYYVFPFSLHLSLSLSLSAPCTLPLFVGKSISNFPRQIDRWTARRAQTK